MGALRLTYKENYRPLKVVRGNFYLQKNSDAERYVFGFNGQLKDNEIYGEGNAYTAEFWEYDPRSIRRWNQDPVKIPGQSPYAVFDNNPIFLTDVKGNCADCDDEEEVTIYTAQEGNTIIAVVQSSTIYAAFEFTMSEALRIEYVNEAAKYVEKTITNSVERKKLKIQYRTVTPPVMRAWLNKVRPLSNEAPPAAGRNPSKTNVKFNKIAGTVGKIGKGLFALNVAYSIYKVSSSDEPEIEAVKQGGIWAGSLAGGLAGGEAGIVVGGFFGPEGPPVGAVAGSIIGAIAGGIAGEKAVDEAIKEIKGFQVIDVDEMIKDHEENFYKKN